MCATNYGKRFIELEGILDDCNNDGSHLKLLVIIDPQREKNVFTIPFALKYCLN